MFRAITVMDLSSRNGENKMNKSEKSGMFDWFRLIAAILVIAIHISPLETINQNADFFLTRVLARTAVPFFFMVTGFLRTSSARKKRL